MNVEIDVLNGDSSWPRAQPLLQTVWPRETMERLPWRHVKWARADLRILIDAPEDADRPGLACHVGLHFRTATWDGRKVEIGGIGGVATHPDCRGRGYATLALNAAIRTLRDHEAVRFAMLFCEPHNAAFYQSRGWHAFEGEVYAEQPEGRIRFEAMTPYIFDFTRKPRDGIIDLCGLPW